MRDPLNAEALIDSLVQDVHVKLLAEAEIAKRISSSIATMRVLYHDVGLPAAEIERQAKAKLFLKGHGETEIARAGVGFERIRKVVGPRARE